MIVVFLLLLAFSCCTLKIARPSGTDLCRSEVSRLLLLSTFDGSLYAFDKYSGDFIWRNSELGGRMLSVGIESEMLLLEPYGDGSIFQSDGQIFQRTLRRIARLGREVQKAC